MNHCIQSCRAAMLAAFLLLLGMGSVHAQSADRDTVEVIQNNGGTYVSCYDLFVTNRQKNTTTISDFRLRLITNGAQFVGGSSGSPPDWAIFQSAREVSWQSNLAASDIKPNQTKSGFRICVRDTGIFRMVWETRNLDSLISSDTFAFASRRGNCDEAFFTQIPSNESCVTDIDLTAGNQLGLVVNDFHLHMITPGAFFKTTSPVVPEGWVRTRVRFDTLVFQASTKPLTRNRFVEGFRIELDAPSDSAIRIEWWTTNFGDPICRDTITLHCGLTAPDIVRRDPNSPSNPCCLNLQLKNVHQPASVLDGMSIKVTTPNVRIIGENAAPGWTRSALNTAADSLAYLLTEDPANGLRALDSALFSGICFDNATASTDTIRYTWRTFRKGVQVSSQSSFLICLRPLTGCDSVGAVVDSTFPSSERCIRLKLSNRNSRGAGITRFVARISNPGTARTIRSASAPAGWVVQRFGGDSVAWTGTLQAGRSLEPFGFCVSLGDGQTGDPLNIAWSTSNATGPLCSDTVRVNANLQLLCDTVRVNELDASNPTACCYRISFTNRNFLNRTIDRLRLEMVGQNAIFSSAMAKAPWVVGGTALPSFEFEFSGSTLVPGAMTADFLVCIDGSQFPNRPTTIPIIWRSYAGNDMVCYDTLRLVCTGNGEAICDTIPLISQRDSTGVGCIYGFRVVNAHQPSGAINGVRFSIVSGSGVFGDARAIDAAGGWSTVDRQRQTVTFRGGTLSAADSVQAFVIRIDSTASGSIGIEASTMLDDQVICTSLHTVQCAASGVEMELAPTGFRLSENRPNPFSGVTEIGYELLHPASVSIVIRDDRGAELRRINRGRQSTGAHTLMLDISEYPSGTYFFTLEAGGEMMTRRMVLIK